MHITKMKGAAVLKHMMHPVTYFLNLLYNSCRDGLTSLSQKQNGEVRAGPAQEIVPRSPTLQLFHKASDSFLY